MQFLFVLSLALLVGAAAFSVNGYRAPVRSMKLRMSEPAEEQGPDPSFQPQDPKLFDMNRRVRLGRSRDQDGKSNIWSIEPTMQVQEEDEGGSGKKNFLVAGLVIGAALGALPLFNLFSSFLPDTADF